MNRIGDKGSPCFNPSVTSKNSDLSIFAESFTQNFTFYAHLALCAKVSFWDSAVSGVRRRQSWVVNNIKYLLLKNHWAKFIHTLS
jgi:hypothetical protein